MPDKLSYLRDTDIFRDLEHAEVEALGKRAPMQRVPAGTVFFSPEQAAAVHSHEYTAARWQLPSRPAIVVGDVSIPRDDAGRQRPR